MLIETINRYESKYLNSMADCKDIIQKAGTQNIGILADFFHMAIEEASIPNAILDGGDMIKYIHLGDNNRLAPGLGSTNWKATVAALKKVGYDGYMTMVTALENLDGTEGDLTSVNLRDALAAVDDFVASKLYFCTDAA